MSPKKKLEKEALKAIKKEIHKEVKIKVNEAFKNDNVKSHLAELVDFVVRKAFTTEEGI